MGLLNSLKRPLELICLTMIMTLAFYCRLMSNIRYETVIHEFDPYFQYKTTIYLVEQGSKKFSDWLDDRTWYPLSRYILPTMYPGLQYTAKFFMDVCKKVFHLPITVLQACSYMGPVMSILGTLFSYDFGVMVDDSDQTKQLTGIISALLFSIIPGFIQRSVAGSFDNESNSITAMVAGFDLWLRACGCSDKSNKKRRANTVTPILAAFGLFYMGFSWGGFVFILCLVPLHVFVCILSGGMTDQIKTAYLIWMPTSYMLMSLVWREYGFVFKQSIALPGIGVYFIIMAMEAYRNMTKLLSRKSQIAIRKFFIVGIVCLVLAFIPVLLKIGLLGKLTGRWLSFISPTHSKKHNPLVASVSEHQPTVWASFYFNTWFLPVILPIGFYYGLIVKRSTGSIFMVIYLTTTTWFSAVMSRMILMASPASSVCGGYVISKILQTVTSINAQKTRKTEKPVENKNINKEGKIALVFSALGLILFFLFTFTRHALWCAKYVYASPSIVLLGQKNEETGRSVYIDDFREAYQWLEHNTHDMARIGSWWDYGYQMNQVGNKVIYADNMTRSPYWIGLMGAILSSPEQTSWRICNDIGVDYMLVLSGAASGYNGDDIGKFMWPVRISANNYFKNKQGYEYFKQYSERDYYNEDMEYRVDQKASNSMKNSMMYKMVYNKLDETMGNQAKDHSRQSGIDIRYANKMELFEEAYSSERQIVRIFRVKEVHNF